MFDQIKKMIEDSEQTTVRLKQINERLQILVDAEKKAADEQKAKIAELERSINDLIFDLKRKEPVQVPEKVYFPKAIGYPLGEKCVWDSIPMQDRYKAMGIYCGCSRCSPHSLVTTEISDGSETFLWLQNRMREAFSGPRHMALNKTKEE